MLPLLLEAGELGYDVISAISGALPTAVGLLDSLEKIYNSLVGADNSKQFSLEAQASSVPSQVVAAVAQDARFDSTAKETYAKALDGVRALKRSIAASGRRFDSKRIAAFQETLIPFIPKIVLTLNGDLQTQYGKMSASAHSSLATTVATSLDSVFDKLPSGVQLKLLQNFAPGFLAASSGAVTPGQMTLGGGSSKVAVDLGASGLLSTTKTGAIDLLGTLKNVFGSAAPQTAAAPVKTLSVPPTGQIKAAPGSTPATTRTPVPVEPQKSAPQQQSSSSGGSSGGGSPSSSGASSAPSRGAGQTGESRSPADLARQISEEKVEDVVDLNPEAAINSDYEREMNANGYVWNEDAQDYVRAVSADPSSPENQDDESDGEEDIPTNPPPEVYARENAGDGYEVFSLQPTEDPDITNLYQTEGGDVYVEQMSESNNNGNQPVAVEIVTDPIEVDVPPQIESADYLPLVVDDTSEPEFADTPYAIVDESEGELTDSEGAYTLDEPDESFSDGNPDWLVED